MSGTRASHNKPHNFATPSSPPTPFSLNCVYACVCTCSVCVCVCVCLHIYALIVCYIFDTALPDWIFLISGYHGSSIPSSMTSALALVKSHPPLGAKVDHWNCWWCSPYFIHSPFLRFRTMLMLSKFPFILYIIILQLLNFACFVWINEC